jgi:hypothetical protein
MNDSKNVFGIQNYGHCCLPFDFAQGGEPVEPFDICILAFRILIRDGSIGCYS